jgi:ubiquitin carboxyl-terminal hydrolase 9/13
LEKSHHSTKIESNGTRDLPAAKPDSLPIHDGVYGSNTSRASLSSSSQASYSQSTSTSSQPPPPPTSFHKQRTSRQYTIDSLPRIPGSPEHKKSFTNLLQGKTSSVLPARPSTAGAAPHRHSMKDRDLPPIPTLSPISPHPNHLRPQSTAGFTTTAEKLASLDAYAGANQGKHRTSKYGHYPSPIQEAPSIVPITSENSSGGNSSNSSSGLQKARRKLSLTAPLLGFGKRDKHKPSHNEVAAS